MESSLSPRWLVKTWSALNALLAITFAVAAVKFSTANLTAPVVYGWIATCHVLVAVALTKQLQAGDEDEF